MDQTPPDNGKALPLPAVSRLRKTSGYPGRPMKAQRQTRSGMKLASDDPIRHTFTYGCRHSGEKPICNGASGMNFIDRAFTLNEKSLNVRAQRMEVLSRNIANADTPHFKAQDIDFKSVMKSASEGSVVTTNTKHLTEAPDDTGDGLRFRIPFNVAFDGNTVELPVEQAKFGLYAAEYQTTLSILENRISGIRKALRGE
jgi:flagellar basal-body rod protein FlgB